MSNLANEVMSKKIFLIKSFHLWITILCLTTDFLQLSGHQFESRSAIKPFASASNIAKQNGFLSKVRLYSTELVESFGEFLDSNAGRATVTAGAVTAGVFVGKAVHNHYKYVEPAIEPIERRLNYSKKVVNNNSGGPGGGGEGGKSLVDLLGSELIRRVDDGTNKNNGWFNCIKGQKLNITKVKTEDVIRDRIIILYVSAYELENAIKTAPNNKEELMPHMMLIDSYYKLKKNNVPVEFIYVPLDAKQEDYKKMMRAIPWPALEFDPTFAKAKELSQHYKFGNLPVVMVVDSQGKVINPDAWSSIILTPNDFPWHPKTPPQIISKLKKNNGTTTSMTDIIETDKKPMIGLYFTASWCAPCRQFTKEFKNIYQSIKETDDNLKIIIVSGDRNEADFDEYYKGMHEDWYSIPFQDETARQALSARYGVRGLPTLILLKTDDWKVVAEDGVARMLLDPKGYPWKPKPVNDLGGVEVKPLVEKPCIIIFSELSSDTERLSKELYNVAKDYSTSEGTTNEYGFYIAKESSQRSKALRQLCGVSDEVKVVLVSLKEGIYWDVPLPSNQINSKNLSLLLEEHKKGKLVKLPMRFADLEKSKKTQN
eukprot:GHVL01026521.1.p1 GENE.GHVL01026521.1~~GHVL01026521.1.p1  ORF type:complete len:598 (-),score=145.15 GHVL01026521.1:64-1857(-)